MGKRQILCERTGGETKLSTHNDKFVVSGIFSQADTLNRNGRVYSYKLWESILKQPELKRALKDRTMVGELGHPEQLETTPVQISHIVTKLELHSDGTVYGEAEILDTPSGRILKTLYEAGVKVGISSRGYLDEGYNLYPDANNNLMVPEDGYELITFDFVIDPSSPDAYPQIKESAARELNTILCENRSRVNSDIAAFITNTTKGTCLNEDRRHLPPTRKPGKPQKEEQLNDVQKQLAEAVKITNGLRERYLLAEEIISDLVKDRDSLNDAIKDLMDHNDNLESEIDAIEAEADTLWADNQEITRDIQTAVKANANLKAHQGTLSEKIKLISSQLESVSRINRGLRASLAEHAVQLKEAEDKYKTAETANKNFELHTSKLEAENADLEEEVKELQRDLKTVENARNHLEMHNSKLKEENAELAEELAQFQTEFETAEHSDRNLQIHKGEASEYELDNLEMENAELVEENRRLKSDLRRLKAAYNRDIATVDSDSAELLRENRQLRQRLSSPQKRTSKAVLSEMARDFNISVSEVSRIYDACADPETATRLYLKAKRTTKTRTVSESELPHANKGIRNREDSHNEYDSYERAKGISQQLPSLSDEITESVMIDTNELESYYEETNPKNSRPLTSYKPGQDPFDAQTLNEEYDISDTAGMPDFDDSSLMNLITASLNWGNKS